MLKELSVIVLRAGEILRSAGDAAQTVREKTSQRDLVTKYDTMVQDFLQRELLTLLPGADFLGEEGEHGTGENAGEWRFIVDPIDGTTNFVQGFPNCCVSVGLMRRGEMEYGLVCNPFSGELYTAQRGAGAFLNGQRIRTADRELSRSLLIFGSALYYRELVGKTLAVFNAAFPRVQDIRRFGSAALDLCYLASGRAGVFYECRLCPWDYAAGALIAREAGCIVTQMDGAPLEYDRKCSVLAGSPKAYRELANIIAEEEEAK